MDLETLLNHLLCPPGMGVYTISTAQNKKNNLHNRLYDPGENVENAWKKSLIKIKEHKSFILGAPSDAGGGIHRGANWGPLVLRELLSQESYKQVLDLGDIRVNPHLLSDELLNESFIKKMRQSLYQNDQIDLPVSPLSILESVAKNIWETKPEARLLTLGGDHSISYPLLKNWLLSRKKLNKKAAVIHFDAHTDLLKERMGVDICFGSWTYHILPFLNSPQDLIQIGIRSSGKDRDHWESQFGIKQWWAKDIKEKGIKYFYELLKKYLQDNKYDEVYVTFDFDSIDAEYASTTGTPESGGLLPTDAIFLLDAILETTKVTSCDFVEFAPYICFTEAHSKRESYQTAKQITQKLIELINL